MDFYERVRKLLGMRREKTIEDEIFERIEEAKWQSTKRKLDAICEADDIEFEVTCTYIDDCDEEKCHYNVSYNVLPIYKEEKKVSKYEEMLNRIGLSTKRQSIQNDTGIKPKKTELDRLVQIIEAEEIEFEPTVLYRLVDGKLKKEIGYEVVIIDKKEIRDDEEVLITLNIDSKSFQHKPDKKETAAIQKRMSSNKQQITVPELTV